MVVTFDDGPRFAWLGRLAFTAHVHNATARLHACDRPKNSQPFGQCQSYLTKQSIYVVCFIMSVDLNDLNRANWVCILCHKMCHYRGLGDLFGPYTIDLSDKAATSGEPTKIIAPKKSKYSLLNHDYSNKEYWIHEDCLVWSEGVHMIGTKIHKLEEVIKASLNQNCFLCKTKGATIGCCGKGCRRKFHYICAKEGKCLFVEENFSLKCDKCLASKPVEQQSAPVN